MAMDVTVGQELTPFAREAGFPAWNRYAAVNDEFIPIHMDDTAGKEAGYSGAFGMGNLQWAYLHNLIREFLAGTGGRIVKLHCQFPARASSTTPSPRRASSPRCARRAASDSSTSTCGPRSKTAPSSPRHRDGEHPRLT